MLSRFIRLRCYEAHPKHTAEGVSYYVAARREAQLGRVPREDGTESALHDRNTNELTSFLGDGRRGDGILQT
jgi:hypothetical protein